MTQSRNLWRDVLYTNTLPLPKGITGTDVVFEWRTVFHTLIPKQQKIMPISSSLVFIWYARWYLQNYLNAPKCLIEHNIGYLGIIKKCWLYLWIFQYLLNWCLKNIVHYSSIICEESWWILVFNCKLWKI